MIKVRFFLGIIYVVACSLSVTICALETKHPKNDTDLANLVDLPDQIIVNIFLWDNDRSYPVMPLICKKLATIFNAVGPEMMLRSIRSQGHITVELSKLLEISAQNRALKKKIKESHIGAVVVFIVPYALTMVVLIMTAVHPQLFDSYFAQGSWAYAETAITSLAFLGSIAGCLTSTDNHYTCCGRNIRGSRCGVFYGMSSQILLGIGNLFNTLFSCLDYKCSAGAYLPISATVAIVPLAVLACGIYELFCRDCEPEEE